MSLIQQLKNTGRLILTYLIFPVSMILFVFSYVKFAHSSGSFAAFEDIPAIGMLSFGTMCLVIIFERILPYNSDWNKYVITDINDIFHWMFSAFTADALAKVVINIYAPYILSHIVFIVDIWPAFLPFSLQIIFAIFLYDFTYYWYHRSFHYSKILWRLHRIHHCSTKLTFSKTFRFNFLEIFTENVLLLGILKLFSAPTEVLIWTMAMINFTVLVKHANIDVRFPRYLDWLLVSPANHRIHHSSDETESQQNFSGFTMLWDVIFGTYRNGNYRSNHPLGVKNHQLSDSFIGQVFDFLKK